jgi:gamma-glutamyl:cysteine ligase YbdK (ATP-grasp superfamily)
MLWSEEDFGADIYPNDDRAGRPMLRFADAFIGTVSLGIYMALILARSYDAFSSETQLTKKRMVVVSTHVSVTCVSSDHNGSSSSDDL